MSTDSTHNNPPRIVRITGGAEFWQGKLGRCFGMVHDLGFYDVQVVGTGTWLMLRADEFSPTDAEFSERRELTARRDSDGNIVVVSRPV